MGGLGLLVLGLLPAVTQGQALAVATAKTGEAAKATAKKPALALVPAPASVAAPVAAPAPLSAQASITRDSIYAEPPVAAEFPGGMVALGAYIGANMRFPLEARQKNITGRVLVQFILGRDGRVQDAHVVSGPGGGLNEEAYRLVWLMPPWEPGRLANGQPVRVNLTLPISFRPPAISENPGGIYGSQAR